jgi:hypothetical protein
VLAALCGLLLLALASPPLHAQSSPPAPTAASPATRPRPICWLATPAALFTQPDVHRESGFACVDCHGGSASSTTQAHAHAPGQGFKGKPAGQALVATCGAMP